MVAGYYQHYSEPPWAMAHEVVHAVMRMADIETNFPFTERHLGYGEHGERMYGLYQHFEEGMCVMLELFFEMETVNDAFAYEAANRRRQTWGWEIRQGRMDFDEVLQYVNTHAIYWLDFIDNWEGGEIFISDSPYRALQSNHTAASFWLYLYTYRGTARGDLLRVYRDINYMRMVHGVDLSQLINSWRRWLEKWR